MDTVLFDKVKITGISGALPMKKVYTDEYIQYYGKRAIDRFKESTGIYSRYYSNGKQTASDLCFVAADNLLKHKNITGEEIDALIFITQTADYTTPSTAFVLQKRLGIKNNCIVFDINLGCSSFVNGLSVLGSMIQCGAIRKGLLLIGDAFLNHPVTDDKSETMLFGDAGTACLIENGEGKIRYIIRSDGNGFDTLMRVTPGNRFPEGIDSQYDNQSVNHMKMNGDDVFLFTIKQVPRLFKDFFRENGCGVDDYDYCILHQANKMIIDQVTKRIKFPEEKVPISISEYGNTNGSSIPLGIIDLYEKNPELDKLKLIVSGFGVGLSWGIADFEIERNSVFPVVCTDDFFEEGFLV